MSRHYKGLTALPVSHRELPGPHDEGIRMLRNVEKNTCTVHLRRISSANRSKPTAARKLARRMETVLVREAFREPSNCAHFRTRAVRREEAVVYRNLKYGPTACYCEECSCNTDFLQCFIIPCAR